MNPAICSRSFRLCLVSVAFAVTWLLVVACAPQKQDSGPSTTAADGTTPVASSDQSTAASPPASRRGGVLRIAQASDPASCDLHSARALSYQSVHLCAPMFSQIIQASTADHPVLEPDLATDWEVSSDGLSWSFHLREGVFWHDGAPFSAEDAVFSLRRAIDPPPGIAPGRASAIGRYISGIDQIVAENGVLVVQTDFVAASFLANLASTYVSIYPETATNALAPPSMNTFESVIGTGPFKPGKVTPGSSYELLRNDEYYLDGLPYLDGVEFHVIPEAAVRLAALRAHEIDTIAIVTEAEAVALEEGAGRDITVLRSPSAGGNTVQLNLSRAPFDDPRVRRSVNLAISRPDAELALGAGYRGAILPPGGRFAYPSEELAELPGYGDVEANRSRARELLAEAGFADGFSTTILTRSNFFFELMSDFVAGQLAQVGINATVIPIGAVEYQQRIMNGDFDMIGHSHSFALDDPDAVLPAHYSCGGTENYPGLCDPELDAMIEEQSHMVDPDERQEILTRIERLIWEKDAKIWFQWSSRRTPVWNNVVGMEPGGPSIYQGRRLDRVYLEPGE